MLKHTHSFPQAPARVVVLGSNGFIGGAIGRSMEAAGLATLMLSRQQIDLMAPDAAAHLAAVLQPNDALVVVSAKAPCKDLAMLRDNLTMVEAICSALQRQSVAHVVYISSDAVYKDSASPLTEVSCAEPASLHGVMHLAREIALRQVHPGPLAIVRPTLVYGLADPHNGYGPNRFRRLAAAGNEIVLFGDGEERRDHVAVEDVAELTRLVVMHRSTGIANAVSGEVVSFRDLAEFASASFPSRVAVRGVARMGPMPHGGYRAFDNKLVLQAFPGFTFKSWREGLSEVHKCQAVGGTR